MHYYLVSTYHGPIVYIDHGSSWAVASPNRPTEIYGGTLPERCRTNAIPIQASEAQQILNQPAQEKAERLLSHSPSLSLSSSL
jgi:hypothetical protein